MGSQLNGAPNLFVIGAMKCGTSSLHRHLAAHPEIFMCDPKEPCGLVAPDELRRHWPKMADLGFAESRERYLELFSEGAARRYRGESSTLYTKLPEIRGVAARMQSLCVDPRLIYILRDPVERTISHYWHQVRQGGERRDMLTAIRDEPEYREVSHYAMQLEPFVERFGRERILLLTLEEMTRAPAAVVGAAAAWLGVDAAFRPPDAEARANVTPTHFDVDSRPGVERFRHSSFWARLGPLVPAPIRRLGRRLTSRSFERGDVDTRPGVDYLRPIQRDQTESLAPLAGRPLRPLWTTLYGD